MQKKKLREERRDGTLYHPEAMTSISLFSLVLCSAACCVTTLSLTSAF